MSAANNFAGEVLGRGFDYLLFAAVGMLVAALVFEPLQEQTLLLVLGPVAVSFLAATVIERRRE